MWTKFDHANVGTKTRHYNRQLYVQGIEPTWTPIKPVATRIVQVVRKQLPLRPAAAKTIHRSQGDTKTRVVVNFNTRKANLHTPYLGLSRVTTIESLHTTDLCEHKIAYNSDVEKGMERLRNDAKWDLLVSTVNNADQRLLTLCYLNTRSSHRHIEDVHKDLNYFNTDVDIFSETRFSHSGNDSMYNVDGCSLFRNGATPLANNVRPFGRMTVYSLIYYYPGYPYSCNPRVERTALRLMTAPHPYIFGTHHSPRVPVSQPCQALSDLICQSSQFK